MNKLIILILIVSVLISCNNESNDNKEKHSHKKETEKNDNSEKVTLSDGEYYFRGVIDHKYSFEMKFELKDHSINGAYYYDSQKKEITLSGNITNGQLELDEMYKEKITGHFTSSSLTADSISGIWKSPKGKKLSFDLLSSNRENYLNHLKKENQQWTKEDFQKFEEKFEETPLPFSYAPLSGEENNPKDLTNEEIKLFIDPGFNPDENWGNRYYYGKKITTKNYTALIYSHEYVPGAFGIFNYNLYIITFSPEGNLIDHEFLGCHCYDNDMNEFTQTTENFDFTENEIIVTGEYLNKSHEWAEHEELPVFEHREPINFKVKISAEGKLSVIK